MIERMPSPAPKRSLKSLEAGLALFPHFRRHISVSGPVTAAQIAAICEATGLRSARSEHWPRGIGRIRLPNRLHLSPEDRLPAHIGSTRW